MYLIFSVKFLLWLLSVNSLVSNAHAKDVAPLFTFPPNKTSFEEAANVCKNVGTTYGVPDDQSHRDLLRRQMQEKGLHSAWLALRKTTFDDWFWINGTRAKAYTVRSGTDLELCAGIALQESNIVPTDCKENRNGFVCEIRGKGGCSVQHFTQACLQIGSRLFIIGCKIGSWYKARAVCQSLGGDLAIVDTNEILNRILNYITDGKHVDICSWLFIGLSMEDWKITRDEEAVVPRIVNWTVGEPRHDSPCAILATTSHIYSWKSSHCDTKTPVVCQDFSQITAGIPQRKEQTTKDDTGQKETNTGYSTWLLVLVAVLGMLVGIAFLAAFIFTHKKVTECKRMKNPDEMESLLGDSAVQEEYQKAKQGITVGLFTDKIRLKSGHVINVNCKGSKVDEFGSNAAALIVSKYNKILASQFRKKNVNPPVITIVNFNVPEASSQIGEKYAVKVFKILTKKYPLDIVYLPGIKIPLSFTAMEKLYDLRSKCVLVCAADMDRNEMPGSEVICIAHDGRSPQQIATGMSDFFVRHKDEKTGQPNSLESVAVTVGLLASVLGYTKSRDEKKYQYLGRTDSMRTFLIDALISTRKSAGFGTFSLDERANDLVFTQLKNLSPVEIRTSVRPDHSYITMNKLEKVLMTVSDYDGETIIILVAATPVNYNFNEGGLVAECKTSDADVEPNKDRRIGTKFTKYICKLLEKCAFSKPEKTKVRIVSIPIRRNDKEVTTDWERFKSGIEQIDSLKEEMKPDLIYISAGGKIPDAGKGIKRTLAAVADRSVVITGAKAYKGPVAPLGYPADSAICVGSPSGTQGSIVDFISNTQIKDADPYIKEHPEEEEQDEEAWVAAADTVCTAAMVLFKARILGIQESQYNNLKKTKVMRNVLLNMCSGYPVHHYKDGYGILWPDTLLDNNQKFREVVQIYAGEKPPPNYWAGKNLEPCHRIIENSTE